MGLTHALGTDPPTCSKIHSENICCTMGGCDCLDFVHPWATASHRRRSQSERTDGPQAYMYIHVHAHGHVSLYLRARGRIRTHLPSQSVSQVQCTYMAFSFLPCYSNLLTDRNRTKEGANSVALVVPLVPPVRQSEKLVEFSVFPPLALGIPLFIITLSRSERPPTNRQDPRNFHRGRRQCLGRRLVFLMS